ncbi:heterokaryon incompatibility protein-domain-containing protein [Pyrenochaeta sp. MPI-SDFR-AT-0127]|nr:heterokaryon incompatibility protein-domain-containing protein [Pyrenochaeta sp. MPI-SDFR-AT-0127]
MVKLRDGKFLRITKLLKEALVFVERQCATGYLWIDQICIDQDDRNERGEQVKVMGQIYSSCSRVLVWLGQISNFDAKLSFEGDLEQSHSFKDVSTPRMSTMKHLIRRLRKVAGSGENSAGGLCHRILQSPWFQRAWVFQEIVLPPSALFILETISTLPNQALTMSLSDLYTMASREAEDIDVDDAIVETIRIMYRRCNEQRRLHGHDNSPIEQTLSLLAPRAKTSEELDRLYAFFGLNFDKCINLTPSYDSSLEVAMIDTATSIIEGTCSLDLFEVIPRAVEYTINNVGIPTWTPDFREEHLVIPFKPSKADFKQLSKSSPNRYPVFISTQTTYYRGTIYCAGEEKRTIQAQGFVLDQVDTEIGTLSSRTTLGVQLNALLKRCVKAWKKINWSVEHQDSLASRYKRKVTGLAASTVELGFAPIPTMERLCQALAAEGCCAISDEHLPPFLSDSAEEASMTTQSMMQIMRGRTLWMTRSGRFALGSYLRCGDHICLAYGSSNPIALRGEHEMNKVLGTCFLEGWMDPWSTGFAYGLWH